MVRVRFLRAKRYPHPSGVKRRAGDELPIPADLASRWEARGIVKRVTKAASVDLAGVPLSGLEAALADVTDADTVRAAQAADDRKGAQQHYEARLAQLEA